MVPQLSPKAQHQINELLVDYNMYVHNNHITCLDDEADSDGAQRFRHSSTQ